MRRNGNLISDITGTKALEKLYVLMTSNVQEQLLLISKLLFGNCKAQAKAILFVSNDWSEEKI